MIEPDPATPQTLHVYCRIDVTVTDPAALREYAVADLRAADIDWSAEEEDLATATARLRTDLPGALSSVVDISRVVDGVPGITFRGGLCRAEPGPVRDFSAPPGQCSGPPGQ